MKKVIVYVFAIMLLSACGDEPKVSNEMMEKDNAQKKSTIVNTKTLQSDIEGLKSFFASQKGKKLDKAKATEMVEKSQHFANAFPDDPIGAAYLFTAGEVARSLGRYEDAINIFTKVESDYPKHEKAALALFLKGFTYEENLRNTDFAKKCYQDFLTKYPDHERTKEVEQLLEVVDVSPEELIERFKEQNKQ